MTSLTLPFQDIEGKHRGVAGGKGYILARLHNAGFPVPPGFVITTEAYHAFVAANDLTPLIDTALNNATSGARDAPVMSIPVVAAFEAATMPPNVVAAINDAYCLLGGGEVAVRSSAEAEDSERSSFAGQHATILNVLGPDAVMAAIRRCWASLWSERALAYRNALRETSDAAPAMAVVVQRMVAAAQAGVAFTCDPITGRGDDIVIEAVAGLGDSLVSGEETPQRYVIQNDEKPQLYRDSVLDPDRVTAVTRLAKAVERWAGCPQDIEWALDVTGQVFLLQARPITRLNEEEAQSIPKERRFRWTRNNVGEVIPQPVTPLSWSVLEPLGNGAFASVLRRLGIRDYPEAGLFGRFYGYVYLNQTLFQSLMRRFYPSCTGWRAWPRLVWTALRAWQLLYRLPAESKTMMQTISEHQGEQKDLAFWRDLGLSTMEVHLAVSAMAELLYQALDKFLTLWNFEDISVTMLVSGLTGVRSAEVGQTLAKIANEIRCDEDLHALVLSTSPKALPGALLTTAKGQKLWRHLEAFLEEHGHSAAQEFELATPRWREDLTVILQEIQAQVRMGNESAAANPVIMRQKAIDEVERSLDGLRRAIFRFLLHRAQKFTVLRENLKYYFVLTHGHLREHYLATAKYLTEKRMLAHQDDIFFLTADEVQELAQEAITSEACQQRIAKHRQAWEIDKQRTPPLTVQQLTDGSICAPPPPRVSDRPEAVLLRGFGASPGVHTGQARIVLTPDAGGALHPGDVLVTQATSPGWSPLLLRAGALVTEIGGTLSHGAIIAREYGIPAVLNVPGATRHLRDGQIVHVDGAQGTIQVVE